MQLKTSHEDSSQNEKLLKPQFSQFQKGKKGGRKNFEKENITRHSKQCGLGIYIFDNSKSKSMVKSEKMALSGLVFARKIARMILIQNI